MKQKWNIRNPLPRLNNQALFHLYRQKTTYPGICACEPRYRPVWAFPAQDGKVARREENGFLEERPVRFPPKKRRSLRKRSLLRKSCPKWNKGPQTVALPWKIVFHFLENSCPLRGTQAVQGGCCSIIVPIDQSARISRIQTTWRDSQ